MIGNILVLILSISISSAAHVLLKKGMIVHGINSTNIDNLFSLIYSLITNPWIIGGMFLHVSALGIWLWALSKVDISFAYPFLGLGYVLVSAMAYLWLGEEINSIRTLGMVIIIIGIFVLAKAG